MPRITTEQLLSKDSQAWAILSNILKSRTNSEDDVQETVLRLYNRLQDVELDRIENPIAFALTILSRVMSKNQPSDRPTGGEAAHERLQQLPQVAYAAPDEEDERALGTYSDEECLIHVFFKRYASEVPPSCFDVMRRLRKKRPELVKYVVQYYRSGWSQPEIARYSHPRRDQSTISRIIDQFPSLFIDELLNVDPSTARWILNWARFIRETGFDVELTIPKQDRHRTHGYSVRLLKLDQVYGILSSLQRAPAEHRLVVSGNTDDLNQFWKDLLLESAFYARYLHCMDDALVLFRRVAENSDTDRLEQAEIHHEMGNTLANTFPRRTAEAMKEFEAVLSVYCDHRYESRQPPHVRLRRDIGTAFRKLEMYDRSEQEYVLSLEYALDNSADRAMQAATLQRLLRTRVEHDVKQGRLGTDELEMLRSLLGGKIVDGRDLGIPATLGRFTTVYVRPEQRIQAQLTEIRALAGSGKGSAEEAQEIAAEIQQTASSLGLWHEFHELWLTLRQWRVPFDLKSRGVPQHLMIK